MFPAVGGGELATYREARYLALRGRTVTVFTTDLLGSSNAERTPVGTERLGLLTICRQRGYLLGRYFVVAPRLLGAMLTAPAELIHANGFGYFHSEVAAWVAKLRRLPLVLSTRGYFPASKRDVPELWTRLYVAWARRTLLRFADLVLVETPEEANAYGNLTPRNKIEVCPGAIFSFDDLRTAPPAGEYPTKLGLADPYFLLLGRITESKGFQSVISALPTFLEGTTDGRGSVVVAGPDYGYETTLRELASALRIPERVRFLGVVDDRTKWGVMAGAAAVVVPSRHEPYGNVVNESLALGVPVVGTKFGGLGDRVLEGETGRLVDPESREELVDALRWAVERNGDDRARIAERARGLLAQGHTVETSTERFIEAYARLARGGGRVSSGAPDG